MAFLFGDGFDCYATTADALAGYWDSGTTTNWNLVAGRFTGSQCVSTASAGGSVAFAKSSAANDAVHHIVVAFRQTAALSGTALGLYFQLADAATNQCCVVFRSDGAILLTSGASGGTVLDTYTGAVTAANTWFAFEFEVVINNTTGSWAVRKNGNSSNDHALGSLNTRPGSNSYANKLSVGQNTSINAQQLDDLLWRSDASSVAFVGDVRCYTRMPASDATAVFSRSLTSFVQPQAIATGSTTAVVLGTGRYTAFTAAYDGTIGTATVALSSGYTGNMKCSIFASTGSAPAAVLGSATPISNPATGVNVFTFGTPVAVVQGTQYWIGFDSDTSSGTFTSSNSAGTGLSSTTSYASFPAASPTTASSFACSYTLTIAIGSNRCLVAEAQQDGTATYVYDSTAGDADFYGIASIGVTPASTIAVTTRGLVEKSDAGTRTAAVQLKSGGTTVQSTPSTMSTTFGWLYRTDTVDPATSAAWTATGVNNAQIGPVVVT
jgi:hypothetical protein